MTSRSYAVDKEAACNVGGGSRRVDQTGMYPGTIQFAWGAKNDNGTESVNLIIDCDNGQKLEQALYTFKGNGEEIPSYKMVHAIMTCCGVRSMTPERGDVTRYDWEAKADMVYKEDVYPELLNKRAIFAVQMEEYTNGQGQQRKRPIIVGVYNADTRRSAAEIWHKSAEARAIEAQQKWLDANPVKQAKAKQAAVAGPSQSASSPVQSTGFDDDDVPF